MEKRRVGNPGNAVCVPSKKQLTDLILILFGDFEADPAASEVRQWVCDYYQTSGVVVIVKSGLGVPPKGSKIVGFVIGPL